MHRQGEEKGLWQLGDGVALLALMCSVFYLWCFRVLFFIVVCGEADTGKRKGGFVYAIHI